MKPIDNSLAGRIRRIIEPVKRAIFGEPRYPTSPPVSIIRFLDADELNINYKAAFQKILPLVSADKLSVAAKELLAAGQTREAALLLGQALEDITREKSTQQNSLELGVK